VVDGLMMLGCLGVGLIGLVYFDRWMKRRAAAMRPEGPGAATAYRPALPPGPDATRARAAELSLMIAVGIGMHNFGEGLAIGASAAAGQLSLAVLLVIGFGAHNATEGFGIVAPLAAAGERPGWGRLVLLGLIGGGPTFLGTLVGQRVTSPLLGVAFLALAAGSILYVVIELLAVARTSKLKELVTWAILLGLVLGFATDAIVTAAGA
jgi:ZIP family zinc transporter